MELADDGWHDAAEAGPPSPLKINWLKLPPDCRRLFTFAGRLPQGGSPGFSFQDRFEL